MRLTLKQNGQPWGQPITSRLGEVVPPAAFPMYLGYGIRGQVRHKVQLSGDETQWVLQQLQGLGEKKKIAQRIWAWPLDIPGQTVATSALTDLAVAVHLIAEAKPSSVVAWRTTSARAWVYQEPSARCSCGGTCRCQHCRGGGAVERGRN